MSKPHDQTPEAAIRELVQSWMDATRRGNLDEICALMTEDAIFTVPGRSPFGKDEFAQGFQSMADMKFSGTSEIIELEIMDDYAFSRNRIDATFTDGEGEETVKASHTLTLYKKCVDGCWKLHRDANIPA